MPVALEKGRYLSLISAIANFKYNQLLVGGMLTVLVLALHYIPISGVQNLMQRIEGILYDTRLVSTLPEIPRKFDEHVVIVDIDEKSMQEQGRFPWSRSKIAKLVTKLSEYGVVVTAFDIFFAEEEENPVTKINRHSPIVLSTATTNELSSIKNSVDADTLFANSLSDIDVVLGYLFDDRAQSRGWLPSSPFKLTDSDVSLSQISEFENALANIELLQRNAAGAGFINSVPETDGFIRKASLVLRYQNKLYPSLALEAARVYTLSDTLSAKFAHTDNASWLQSISFGNTEIPTSELGQVLIPYKGNQRSFPYVSATDVLNGRVSPELLEGAVVFVGTSAVGLADLRTTSVGVQYPGV